MVEPPERRMSSSAFTDIRDGRTLKQRALGLIRAKTDAAAYYSWMDCR